MDIKSFRKEVAIAQVEKALVAYGLTVKPQLNSSLYGDLIAHWKRNEKNYLVFITARITKDETLKQSFRDTIQFANANKLKLVIIAWEIENKLNDYTLDLEGEDFLDFKIIHFNKVKDLKDQLSAIINL